MREANIVRYIQDLQRLCILPSLAGKNKEAIGRLTALTVEFTGDIAEACNDIVKDISNHMSMPDGEEKAALILSVISTCLINMLAWYLGNYQEPFRKDVTTTMLAYLKEAIEDAASYLREEYERKSNP